MNLHSNKFKIEDGWCFCIWFELWIISFKFLHANLNLSACKAKPQLFVEVPRVKTDKSTISDYLLLVWTLLTVSKSEWNIISHHSYQKETTENNVYVCDLVKLKVILFKRFEIWFRDTVVLRNYSSHFIWVRNK